MKKYILLITSIFLLLEAPAQDRPAAEPEQVQLLAGTEERQLQVYPNPSTGIVNVSLKGFYNQKTEIRITNVIGNVVYKETVSEFNDFFTKTFDLTQYAKGLYYIKIESENFSDIKKVIVK